MTTPVRVADAADPEALAAALDEACRELAAGRLVAFPTETVYGLGADARRPEAVRGIYRAKGRPARNPLIVHLASIDEVPSWAVWTPAGRALAEAFWPGPLTLVLPLAAESGVAPEVTAGGSTIGLRVPSHPVARALLERHGSGLAAPSANLSERVSPTRAVHVAADFAGRAEGPALILDGGACEAGLESTVVDASVEPPRVLRLGSLTLARLRRVRPELEGPAFAAGDDAEGEGPLRSPGRLSRHYAPRCPVRLEARELRAGEALLAFGPPLPGAGEVFQLSAAGDLQEAARRLYDGLRALDRPGCVGIAVMPIPAEGLGAALRDRLRRAATRSPSEPGAS